MENEEERQTVSEFVGGNIKNFRNSWELYTNDINVLNFVSGVKINFINLPQQSFVPKEISCSFVEGECIDKEIKIFKMKGIIKKVVHCKGEYISHIFTRSKPNGKLRIILNLNKLNESVEYEHFKMESFTTALSLIEQNCFMGSIDLKDAYYSVSVAEEYRKYLRFTWRSVLYEFTCLPMGLACSPRIFTKLLKPIFCYLRSIGLMSVYYLDDSLLFGDSLHSCTDNLSKTASTLESLGFTINIEKSVFKPSRVIKFLGFIIDSEKMIVTLPVEKREKLIKLGTELLECEQVLILSLASFIGNLVSCFEAVQMGPLYYRYLEINKTLALRKSKGDFNSFTTLCSESKNEINWWIRNINNSSKTIVTPNVDIMFSSDASNTGWGAVWNDVSTGGRWADTELGLHINVLELKAMLFGLNSFFRSETGKHIRIRTDSMTALSYVNNLGGTRSVKCHKVAKEIWEWALQRSVWLSVDFLPGVCNTAADSASRKFIDDTEWAIPQKYFEKICEIFGYVEIDLFASRLNNKISVYVSWKPDPTALFIDAFSRNWGKLKWYAFPPFSIVDECLKKISLDEASGIILVPLWPTQHWFPKLVNMLISEPIILPLNILYLPFREEVHQLNKNLRMMACHVSGNSILIKDFQKTLSKSLPHHGEQIRLNNTKSILRNGIISVVNGKLITCQLMKKLS